MGQKPSYEELERNVKRLRKEVARYRRAEREGLRRERLQGVLEMAGAVCHEFNQPMQVLYAYCECSLKELSEKDPLHNRIKNIMNKIEKMALITRKLERIATYQTKDYIYGTKIIDIDKASRVA